MKTYINFLLEYYQQSSFYVCDITCCPIGYNVFGFKEIFFHYEYLPDTDHTTSRNAPEVISDLVHYKKLDNTTGLNLKLNYI